MLPNLRLIAISAFVTCAVLIGAFGVTAAVRGVQNTASSPLDSLKGGTAFDDRLDWNQFANPDSTRLYEIITARASLEPVVEGGRGGPFTPIDAAGRLPMQENVAEPEDEVTGTLPPAAPEIDVAALIDAQVGSDPGAVLAGPSVFEPADFGPAPHQPVVAATAPPAQVRSQAAPRKRVVRRRPVRAAKRVAPPPPVEPAKPSSGFSGLFGRS